MGSNLKTVNKVSGEGYTVGGRHYKRIPQGYDADNPGAQFLQYNGLHAMMEEKVPAAFYSGALIDHAFAHYKNMLPLHRWLLKVLQKSIND